jgi:hypothetical protein
LWMAMFCCASANYDWVEHISSTRAIVRTRRITCENPSVHFGEKPPRIVNKYIARFFFPFLLLKSSG